MATLEKAKETKIENSEYCICGSHRMIHKGYNKELPVHLKQFIEDHEFKAAN